MTTAETIATNLENQILAFQQQIEARPEGQRCPTAQEINLQCKLLNCLMRLRKPPARAARRNKETSEDQPGTDLSVIAGILQEMRNASPAIPPPQRTTTKMTQQEFETHKHLMGTIKDTRSNVSMKLSGRYVNAWWLEYTLYQYCLPFEDRRFIDDPQQIITEIDHTATQAAIAAYLSQEKMRLAA